MRVLALLAVWSLPAIAAAQSARAPAFLDAEPAAARLSTRHLEAVVEGDARVGADGRAVVSVRVTPAPKMHVYAHDVEGYVPFTVSVAGRGVTPGKVTFPRSEVYVFPPTGESSRAYMQPFVVKQALTVDAAARARLDAGTPVHVTVNLRYQACDDRVCYRPASGTLRVDLTR